MIRNFVLKAVTFVTAAIAVLLPNFGSAHADPVIFSSATATFHQTFDRDWNPAEMINGDTSASNGWAIFRNGGGGDQTLSETALFTLQSPLSAGPESVTFNLFQNHGEQHLLGNFSLAYTTDVAPTLSSTQTMFSVVSATSQNGTTFSFPAAGQLLVTNPNTAPNTDVYTIFANANSAAPITGFFLNAINDPTDGLATGGPGIVPSNGNFVVSEFTADLAGPATPEPGSVALFFGLSLVGVREGWRRAHSRRQA